MRTCTTSATTTSLLSDSASATHPSFPIKPGKLFINGEWRNSTNGKTFSVIDPTTEEVVTQIAEGTQEDPHSV